MKEIIIKNLSDLKNYADDLAGELRGGMIVALSGELGAGKTTLVQLIGRALGLHKNILSPTFNILKIYSVVNNSFKQICHIDLYRLDNFSDMQFFGDYIGDKNTVCFIEWAEKIKFLLPKNTLWMTIKIDSKGQRIILQKNKPQ